MNACRQHLRATECAIIHHGRYDVVIKESKYRERRVVQTTTYHMRWSPSANKIILKFSYRTATINCVPYRFTTLNFTTLSNTFAYEDQNYMKHFFVCL